jgi:peptidoglycan/LPS O-acetylase OafA/YrhL
LWVLAEFGWLGVQLFFVISGYCIAATADSCRRRTDGLADYCRRRFLRIYPPYAVWLVVLTAVLAAAEAAYPDAAFWSQKRRFVAVSQMHPGEWLSNLALVQTWLPRLLEWRMINVTEVAWTLCYEVQFYALVGLMLVITPGRLFAASAALTIVLGVLFAALPALDWRPSLEGTFLDGRWLQFALGMGVYYALVHASAWTRRLLLTVACLTAVGCLVASRNVFQLDFSTREKRVFELGCSALFALLLVLVRPLDARPSVRALLAPIAAVGTASYSLYLVHWPVCKVISAGLWGRGMRSSLATALVVIPLCVAASLVAACLYYRLVERRFLATRTRPALSPAVLTTPASPGPSTTSPA